METTDYYEREARRKHPGIADEWVERVLSIPQSQELQPDGRVRYFGYIAEAGKWLRVVVADGKVHNRMFDRGKLRKWGHP